MSDEKMTIDEMCEAMEAIRGYAHSNNVTPIYGVDVQESAAEIIDSLATQVIASLRELAAARARIAELENECDEVNWLINVTQAGARARIDQLEIRMGRMIEEQNAIHRGFANTDQ